MGSQNIIKKSTFACILRIVGIFMIFILTSCPIKASIKQTVNSQAPSGLTLKQTKLMLPSEAPCVLDIRENLEKVSHSNLDFSPLELLLAFLCSLFLSFPKEIVGVRLPLIYHSGLNNLFIFFKRFNL